MRDPKKVATVSKPDPAEVFYYTYMTYRIINKRNTFVVGCTPESCLSNDFPSGKDMLVASMETNCTVQSSVKV